MNFYNPDSRCNKCGCTAVGVKFFCGVMKRNCTKCCYEWDEKPLDQQTSQDIIDRFRSRLDDDGKCGSGFERERPLK